MLVDFAVPPGREPPLSSAQLGPISYQAGLWDGERLAACALELARVGAVRPRGSARDGLLAAWVETVEAFLNPGSPERRELEEALATSCGLSSRGLAVGLEAVLGGVRERAARELFAQAAALAPADPSPVLVVLAANLPALAVQPLLPALALGRPVLLKSPSAEPFFAPAFVRALVKRHPPLASAVAALTWPGGSEALEAPLLAACGRVLAYGGAEAISELERRAPGMVVPYGPKASLAVLARDANPWLLAPALARDITLFDQRGCLSVQAIYVGGQAQTRSQAGAGGPTEELAIGFANELAEALALALTERATLWPPGPIPPATAAAVQQLRAEADLRGLLRPGLPLSAGTVIVDSNPEFRPSPGLRTVRIHPLSDLALLPEILAPWRGQLQGVALAGAEAWGLHDALAALGCSRFAPPGELQSPDATWHNGGISPLAALL